MNEEDFSLCERIGSSGTLSSSKFDSPSSAPPRLLGSSKQLKVTLADFPTKDVNEDKDKSQYTFGRAQSSQTDLMLALQSTTGKLESSLAGQSTPLTAKPERIPSKSSFANDIDMVDIYKTSLAPRIYDRKRRSSSRDEGSPLQSADLEARDFAIEDGPLRERLHQKRLASSFEEARRLSGDSQRRYRGIERALEAQNDEESLPIRMRTVSEPITSFTLPSKGTLEEDKNIGQYPLIKETARDQKHASDPLPIKVRAVSLSAPADSSRHVNNRSSAGAQFSGMASSGVMPWKPAQLTAFSLQHPHIPRHHEIDDNNIMPLHDARLSTTNYKILSEEQRFVASYHLDALHAMRPKLPPDAHNELRYLLYTSWLSHLHRIILPLITYAHVFITIFFDYNTLYCIIQVALYPDSTSASTAWWIAVGIYCASFICWSIGVVVIWEIYIQYYSRCRYANPFALSIYLSSSAFSLASIQSASLYSLFYRARLSAHRQDFITETFWYYSQNWPTVLTLLPRGIIISIFLVLYNPISSSMQSTIMVTSRDSVYFDTSNGLLTRFAFVVLLLNAIWIAWRLLLLLSTYIGLWIMLGSEAILARDRTLYDWTASNKDPAALLELVIHSHSHSRQYTKAEPMEVTRVAIDEDGDRPEGIIYLTQLPRWAWRSRAEERLQSFLVTCPPPLSHIAVSKSGEDSRGLELETFLVGSHRVDRADEISEMERGKLRPWTTLNTLAASEINSRGSNSFDKLRVAPRLVLPGDASILTSIQDSPRSNEQTEKIKGKGKEKFIDSSDDTDPALSNQGVFVPHERPTSDSTPSSMLSTSTFLPRSMIRSMSPDMHPFPRYSGELTPKLANNAGRMQRLPSSSPEPFTSDVIVPSSSAIASVVSPVKRGRASTSLSSLSESLRFGKGNRTADSVVKDDRETSMDKTEGAWWSAWIKGKGLTSSADIKSDEQGEGKEEIREDDEDVAAVSIPADSEKGTIRTHDTTTTEDSEERRLWSQFPEQSRRFPPGLIALELEQRQLIKEQERFQSEGANQRSLEKVTSLQREEEEAGPPRLSTEGLVPIKEESWSSSLDSASNESQ